MVQTDSYWRVHTKGQNTVIGTNALSEPSEVNRLTKGDTATFRFRFTQDSLTVEANETYTVSANTTEIFTTKNVKENGQINVEENGELIITGTDNFVELENYSPLAGNFAVSESLNRTQNYREFIPSGADISSLVLGIEPSQALKDSDITGIWGIVTAAEDTRPSALSDDQFQLELRVLDDFSAYADHSAVATDLEV